MLIGTDVYLKSKVTIIDGSQPDSVTIDIYDPKGSKIVDNEAASDEGNGVFSYIFQSSVNGLKGWYSAVFNAKKGSNKGVSDIEFELEGRKKTLKFI